MNYRNVILFVLILLFLYPQAGAQEITYDIAITLSEGSAHESMSITINNTAGVPLEDFSYELPTDAREIRVYDALGVLNPDIVHGDSVIISSDFREPLQPGTQGTIWIEFDTKELLSTLGEERIFSARFSPTGDTKGFTLKVSLPKGMGLPNPISSSPRTDIVPIPDRTISDGTTTSFEWEADNVGDFAVFIRYAFLTPTTLITTTSLLSEPPVSKEGSRSYLWAVPVLLIITLASYYFLKQGRDLSGKTEFMKEDEKLIIDLVRGSEGIVQKRLVDHTGFSKAKVSKIVSDLEKRKIIRVEKIGRRNKLFLTEEFKKR